MRKAIKAVKWKLVRENKSLNAFAAVESEEIAVRVEEKIDSVPEHASIPLNTTNTVSTEPR